MKAPRGSSTTSASAPQTPLIDYVRQTCRRLAPGGWAELFESHGLDILADDLVTELRKALPRIDRTIPGFEDFAYEGVRAVEPGAPARSLLFHALASPHVFRGKEGELLSLFPTQAEIETVENYVYGPNPPSVYDLRARVGDGPLAIVVFAAEYRPAINTAHQRHADMCFSRTGVSRVGVNEPLYLERERGYLPFVDDDDHGIRVIPCRYSPYLAVLSRGSKDDFRPMRFREDVELTRDVDGAVRTIQVAGDGQRSFWVPIHKLFSGRECLRDAELDVSLRGFHVNQKLRKVHQAFAAQGFDTGWHEPCLSQPPFVFYEGL